MVDLYSSFLEKHSDFTEIQKLSMGIIEGGSNCLIVAPTGAGKTEAAVLPLLRALAGRGLPPINVLYITPLRALNRDMLGRLEELCKIAGITIGVRHGDTTQKERSRQARLAPSLLITTPETLQSILPTKYMGAYLRNLKVVVIDELHELYHNKRGAQLSVALERLEELSPNFQRIGISATIGDTQTAKSFLCGDRNCKIAKVGSVRDVRLSVEMPQNPGKGSEEMRDRFGLDGPSMARLERISELVRHSRSALIFANTRQIVESVGSRLLYLNGINPFGGMGIHHSSLDKAERIEIENSFKNGNIRGIMSTSSLELGIDIGSIDLVIQYGSPRQALRLAQRVGRSGHTHKGTARGVVIATNPMEALETFAIFRILKEGEFERFRPQLGALDVLANQICGIALDKGKIELEALLRIIRRSFIYRDADSALLARLAGFMLKLRLIGFDGKFITSGSRTRMYYYSHLSTIPDSKRFIVKNVMENRTISSLDERFVANNVDEGSIFITKGLPWRVISIDGGVISVEPSTDLEAAVPDWTGEDIPVSGKTVENVFGFFGSKRMDQGAELDQGTYTAMKRLVESQRQHFIPSKSELAIERLDDHCIIYTGLGTQANEALSRLLAHLVSLKLGASINVKSSPYMIMLDVNRDFDIAGILKSMGPDAAENALREALSDTELFRYRFITVAKLFGIIDRDATVSRSVARKVMRVMQGTPMYDETFRELMENYFDIGALREFFGMLDKGLIDVKQYDLGSASPLTRLILNSAYYTKELITPLTPNSALVESFARFIMQKSAKLLCTYCGFTFSRKLSEIKDSGRISCPGCGSPMITFYEDSYAGVIRKRIGSKRLNAKEKSVLKEMLQYSSLIEAYGPKAVIALSVYGVGPRSAARILMMLRREEKTFFLDLIEAQKSFIRTKKYWSV
ncbi:MAG: DEAD/DEAH box helicase [Candidatus Micrarchaeota archaeon]|nr:DEAD/DEAH box helicase [Candidatus Micrarchaeota archaeon]